MLENFKFTKPSQRNDYDLIKLTYKQLTNLLHFFSVLLTLEGAYKTGEFWTPVKLKKSETEFNKKDSEDVFGFCTEIFKQIDYSKLSKLDFNMGNKTEEILHKRNGTYLVMEGPQFSTLAESELYRSWGADVIGMTNMPEAKLAREAEIRYASISMVTDFDCWHPDHDNVDVKQIIETLSRNSLNAKKVVKNLILNFEKFIDKQDPTNNCLDFAIITAPEKRTKKTKDKLKNIAGRVL